MGDRAPLRRTLLAPVLFVISIAALSALPQPSSAAEPLTVTSLTADTTFPVAAGTPVTWTALATGGTAPYAYKFYVFDGSSWILGRDWSDANTWTWSPPSGGDYEVHVWIRNAGSSNLADGWLAATATIAHLPTLRVTSVTRSTESVTAGSPVTWTATADGGVPPYTYTYHFAVYDGVRWDSNDFILGNTWTWTPPAAGTFSFKVCVDSYYVSGVCRTLDPMTVRVPTALTVTSLTENRSVPIVGVRPGKSVAAGTVVTWTATALGGLAPYSYKFYVFDGTSWSLGRDWSALNTWTWIPPASGHYTVQVWARNEGSSTVDAWRSVGPVIITPGLSTITIFTFQSDRVFPVHPAGTPVQLRSDVLLGGTGPYTFKFYVWDGSAWTIGQDWSTAGLFTWVPPAPGSYRLQVWVRNGGSMTAFDAWAETQIPVGSAVPLAVTRFTMSPMSPLVVNGPATFAATVIGGTGPYTYQFWVYDGASWSLGRDWDAANSFSWVPPAAGTYSFQVWVRNAESMTAFDTWASLGPVTVIP